MATVLITGANRGIGLALARHAVARGDQVIATCRQSSPALDQLGAQVEAGIDVTDERALAGLARRLQGQSLDRLWLNAGILSKETFGTLDEASFTAMRRQFEVNALGPLRVAQALSERMVSGTRIGILTSRMGSMADNGSGGYYGYRASKAAVNAIGRSLALDLKSRGIAVLLLHPGFVATDMVGGQGDIAPDAAALRLLTRLETLGLAETGSFWHADGTPLPW